MPYSLSHTNQPCSLVEGDYRRCSDPGGRGAPRGLVAVSPFPSSRSSKEQQTCSSHLHCFPSIFLDHSLKFCFVFLKQGREGAARQSKPLTAHEYLWACPCRLGGRLSSALHRRGLASPPELTAPCASVSASSASKPMNSSWLWPRASRASSWGSSGRPVWGRPLVSLAGSLYPCSPSPSLCWSPAPHLAVGTGTPPNNMKFTCQVCFSFFPHDRVSKLFMLNAAGAEVETALQTS